QSRAANDPASNRRHEFERRRDQEQGVDRLFHRLAALGQVDGRQDDSNNGERRGHSGPQKSPEILPHNHPHRPPPPPPRLRPLPPPLWLLYVQHPARTTGGPPLGQTMPPERNPWSGLL